MKVKNKICFSEFRVHGMRSRKGFDRVKVKFTVNRLSGLRWSLLDALFGEYR